MENQGKQKIYSLGKNFWLVEYDLWFALGYPSVSKFMREYKKILRMQSWLQKYWHKLAWAIIKACRKNPNKKIIIPWEGSYLDLRLIDYIKLIEPIARKIPLRVLDVNPPSSDEAFLREIAKIKTSPHAIGRAARALEYLPSVLEGLGISFGFGEDEIEEKLRKAGLFLGEDYDFVWHPERCLWTGERDIALRITKALGRKWDGYYTGRKWHGYFWNLPLRKNIKQKKKKG